MTDRCALIVGSHAGVVIPIARSLTSHGIRCVVAVPPGESFPFRSRSVDDVVHLEGSHSDAASLLGMVVGSERAGLVLPTTDTAVLMVAELRRRTGESPALAGASLDAVNAILDRERLSAAATAAGVAMGDTSARKSGIRVGVGILMHDGEAVSVYQQRSTTVIAQTTRLIIESETPDPRLVEASVSLLRTVGFEGPALVEFECAQPAGDYQFAGIQGHLWTSIALAIRAGANFPMHMWLLAHGTAVPDGHASTTGVRMGFRERTEANSGAQAVSAGLWSWRDPVPSLQEWLGVLSVWLATFVTPALRRVVPHGLMRAIRTARDLTPEARGIYLRRRGSRTFMPGHTVMLPQNVRSVLFVCHGNVMRSAAAEHFLRAVVSSTPSPRVEVASAGTHAHSGRPADERVQRAALQLGVGLDSHRSQPIDRSLVDRADVILAMDDANVANVVARYPDAASKTFLLGDFMQRDSHSSAQIEDPYFESDEGVARTIGVVHDAVTQFARALREGAAGN